MYNRLVRVPEPTELTKGDKTKCASTWGGGTTPLIEILPTIMFALRRSFASRAVTQLAARGLSIASNAARPLIACTALASTAAIASCDPAPVIYMAGEPGTKRERTLILVKPDGVERGVVGAVMNKFEAKGFKLVGLKMLTPTLEQAQDNYAGLKHLPFFPGLCSYFASGPIVCMCWEGKDVIKTGRGMVDEVRAVYAADRGRNCIDGSDSVEGAAEELGRWFTHEDMSNYTRAVDAKIYA